jgi:hypothetical protein
MSFGGRVKDLVPPRDAYIRVLHPPGENATWSDVALRNGKTPHKCMQWTLIQPGGSDAQAPVPGELHRSILLSLARAIGVRRLFAATWEGWGSLPPQDDAVIASRPMRCYRVTEESWKSLADGPHRPAFLWGASHEWISSTDVDMDSTIIAGNRELIARLATDDSIESWVVEADDSIELGGDRINLSRDAPQ